MFSFFKRPKEKFPERVPRGVLPTYVTDNLVVLSKAAPVLRNTYEIRLALYMATSKGLGFVLAVRPDTRIDASLAALLSEHGGKIEETPLADHSVYFGYASLTGEEEGWVLGSAATLSELVKHFDSEWLREYIHVGANFTDSRLDELEKALLSETVNASNIDGENVRDALLVLVRAAKKKGGTVFVQ